MNLPILMITALAGSENCAMAMGRQLGLSVEVADTRKAALTALRRREYSVVVVDDSLAESDPAGMELIWKHAALAVPLQVNFAISGASRLAREVRLALSRREQEQSLAMRAAASTIENELKSTVTGLLLQSQLALAEPSASPVLTEKLKLMVELAGNLRQQLARPQA
ncbi:MAG TPA: hypothetical protein VM554_00795 [Acidisarcina sp.]|nr:hypothetical protein [Acidisarcina sp.]